MKSTVDEIKNRFDNDVERFSNLETGQSATMDAPLALELVARAANVSTPRAQHVLDIGCGAGNFTLRLQSFRPVPEVTLIDLSLPMLERAVERISISTDVRPVAVQTDIRDFKGTPGSCDVVLAGAVLHHLRSDEEWEETFGKIYSWLRPGGSFWIFDMVTASTEPVHSVLWQRYGSYLEALKDRSYRDRVFAYIEKEDTPRPLVYQLDLLKDVGFAQREVLHTNAVFAAFGGIKAGG